MATKKVKDKEKKPDKAEEVKRPKLIRDSFTMPETDVARLKALKKRCLTAGIDVKKSELLRAGLLALEQMDDAQLNGIVMQIERLKTGRPAKKAD